ncbi:MAG: type II secretion system F family protein [Microthrixaceae bacterium]
MRSSKRADRLLEQQLPGVAAGLARSVHSGATLLVAIEELGELAVAPSGKDLLGVAASVRRGGSLDAALDLWQQSRRGTSVDLLVTACRFGYAEGGNLAAALDGAAVSILDRIEVADEARALASQARSSAAVLVVLPLLGAAVFSVLDPAVAATLFTTAAGWVCLVVGLTLDALGAWVLSRMVRSALS